MIGFNTMEKKTLDINPLLVEAANSTRRMLMNRRYFVRDVLLIDENVMDVVAIKEGLIISEKWRIRLIIPPAHGGLGTIPVQAFFREQRRVHDVKGFMISLGPISIQAKRLIEKENIPVFPQSWLKENSDFGSLEEN